MTLLHAMTLGAALVTTAAGAAEKKTPKDLEADVKAWHEKRIRSLTSEDGWLTLVGLHWLEEGANAAGSAGENAVVFPENAPPKVGTFTRSGKTVRFEPAAGVAVTRGGQPFAGGALQTDEKGAPDVLSLGTFRFHVIVRGDRVGVRLKDVEAKARKEFHAIGRFPVTPRWRVDARLVTTDQLKRKIAVPNVLGTVEEMNSPGALVFTVEGKEHRLYPVVEEGSDKLFLIFADETNKDATYGAGRFLYADLPKDGKVTLDFNRAYNPPCAFSPYATCPLPPKENRLAVRVEAGEKRYADH